MKKPTVIVLAGGLGNRFEPLKIDKTMIPFLGKPLIQHTLNNLENVGFEEKNIFVAANENNFKWLKENHKGLSKLVKPDGMASAVLPFVKEVESRPVLIVNPNDIFDTSLYSEVLEKSEGEDGLMVSIEVEKYFPGGYLELDADRVVSVVEKPGEGNQPSNFVKIVFDYLADSQLFFKLLKETESLCDDVYEASLCKYLQQKNVKNLPYKGVWKTLKFNFHVLDVAEVFLENRIEKYISKSAQIDQSAKIEGDVYIDDGAKIFENAVIKGPAYIGKNVIIGNNSLVRNSIVEQASVIGFCSEVVRSYVGPRCGLHANIVEDSILESDLNMGAQTVTMNLRHDQKEVTTMVKDELVKTGRNKFGAIICKGAKLGAGTKINPGRQIYPNCTTMPNEVVYKNIE